ncbi:phosphoribosyl transferase [Candidatus Uhrbacteria bacterium]|nr:phosphoribosyl transferase [Candidatus Uhrbacteria bacterium]
MRFHDRTQAAKELAKVLRKYRGEEVVVYALPRGGVILGQIVATYLHAPLDLLVPRKIGHPSMPEFAIAAVTELGEVVQNKEEVARVDPAWFAQAVEQERKEAKRRREVYLQGRARADVAGKTAIIVDDGIATGLTVRAAIADVRRSKPARVILAVPVAPRDTVQALEGLVDQVIVLEMPQFFQGSIGAYYDSFDQVSDEEVVHLLSKNSV